MIKIYDWVKAKLESGEEELSQRMASIEAMIRAETNNAFESGIRWGLCISRDGALIGLTAFQTGDTVQISGSKINDGLYVVKALEAGDRIVLNRPLEDAQYNRVALVEYPPDVVSGANMLLVWGIQNEDKAGIRSESLSRHSVTYEDMPTGYPQSLMGFLRPYRKARF